jgi:hypothetical protein
MVGVHLSGAHNLRVGYMSITGASAINLFTTVSYDFS